MVQSWIQKFRPEDPRRIQAFRKKLEAAIDMMVDGYSGVLTEAQKRGEISEFFDVRETAYFIVASWHGALIRMKLVKNLEPLENHRKFIFDRILRP